MALLNDRGNVFGTYWHGLFDNREWTDRLLNNLRRSKGMEEREQAGVNYAAFKETQYDLLADSVRKAIDIDHLYAILGMDGPGEAGEDR